MSYEKKYLKYKKKYFELKKLEEQMSNIKLQNAGENENNENNEDKKQISINKSNPFNMLSEVLIGSTLDKLKNSN